MFTNDQAKLLEGVALNLRECGSALTSLTFEAFLDPDKALGVEAAQVAEKFLRLSSALARVSGITVHGLPVVYNRDKSVFEGFFAGCGFMAEDLVHMAKLLSGLGESVRSIELEVVPMERELGPLEDMARLLFVIGEAMSDVSQVAAKSVGQDPIEQKLLHITSFMKDFGRAALLFRGQVSYSLARARARSRNR